MTTPYDECYKRLFSNPQMVQDLLINIFKEDWVQDLDFSSLEKLDKEYINSKLRKKSNDIVWKAKWHGKNIYLLLILEFQSSVDQFMILRILNYVSEIYLTLIKIDKNITTTNTLPPVLPIVLYNGDKTWNAATNIQELLAKDLPNNLLKYQPNISYWLLSELDYNITTHTARNSLVGLLLKLEQSNDITEFIANTKYFTVDSLEIWQDFLLYVKYILKREENLLPEKLFELQKEVGMLQGTLYERARIWEKELFDKGKQYWMQQGMQQGIQKGELTIIKNMLTTKFGPIPRKQLQLLNKLTSKQLLQFSNKIINANTLAEALEHVAILEI